MGFSMSTFQIQMRTLFIARHLFISSDLLGSGKNLFQLNGVVEKRGRYYLTKISGRSGANRKFRSWIKSEIRIFNSLSIKAEAGEKE